MPHRTDVLQGRIPFPGNHPDGDRRTEPREKKSRTRPSSPDLLSSESAQRQDERHYNEQKDRHDDKNHG